MVLPEELYAEFDSILKNTKAIIEAKMEAWNADVRNNLLKHCNETYSEELGQMFMQLDGAPGTPELDKALADAEEQMKDLVKRAREVFGENLASSSSSQQVGLNDKQKKDQ